MYKGINFWAFENGIITGYKDNTFKPTKVITRAESDAKETN